MRTRGTRSEYAEYLRQYDDRDRNADCAQQNTTHGNIPELRTRGNAAARPRLPSGGAKTPEDGGQATTGPPDPSDGPQQPIEQPERTRIPLAAIL